MDIALLEELRDAFSALARDDSARALFLNAVSEVEPEATEMLKSVADELPQHPVGDSLPSVPISRVAEWCSRFHLNAAW